MPELPEVETTRRGILPHVKHQTIEDVVVRQAKLRYPIPSNLSDLMAELKIDEIHRRSKYLLFETRQGHLLIHLGMSGSLRILPLDTPTGKHDHVDFIFDNQTCLRYTDPRKFGMILWTNEPLAEHKLLNTLGPEPLEDDFDAAYLYEKSRGKKQAIKNFIMDSHVVVGVGNIYANESLFLSGIHPKRAANRISYQRYEVLVDNIKKVLAYAIQRGGTTLRDFTNSEGKPGYFQQELNVYGRAGEACKQCGATIQLAKIGQRSSFYCKACQR